MKYLVFIATALISFNVFAQAEAGLDCYVDTTAGRALMDKQADRYVSHYAKIGDYKVVVVENLFSQGIELGVSSPEKMILTTLMPLVNDANKISRTDLSLPDQDIVVMCVKAKKN